MAEPAREINPDIEPDIRPHLGVIQGGGETTDERASLSSASPAPAEKLADKENRFGVIQGGGETTDERAKLASVSPKESDEGELYANGPQLKGAWARMQGIRSNKKLFRNMGLGGGIVLAVGIGFLSLLPLKLEMLIKTVSANAAGVPEHAIDHRLQYLTQRYIAMRILGSAYGQDIDVKQNSIVAGMFTAWRAANYEKKLGISIESDRRNPRERAVKWTIRDLDGNRIAGGVTGNDIDMDRMTREISGSSDMRDFLREETKKATKSHQYYKRYAMRKLLMRKYGVSRWAWLPKDTSDKLDNKAEALRDFKRRSYDNTVGRVKGKTGIYIRCLTEGYSTCKDLRNAGDRSTSAIESQQSDLACGEGSDCTDRNANQDRADAGAEQTNSNIDNADTVDVGADGAPGGREASKWVTKQLLAKVAGGLGIVDTLMRIVNGIENGAINQVVFDRNSTAYIGYTAEVLAINDQMKDGGDITLEQVAAIMEQTGDFGASPAWQAESGVLSSAQVSKSNFKRSCPTDEGDQQTTLKTGETVCSDRKVVSEKNPFEGDAWWETFASWADKYLKTVGKAFDLFYNVLGGVASALHIDDFMAKIGEATGASKLIAAGMGKMLNLIFGAPVTGLETGPDAADNVIAGIYSQNFAFGQTGQDMGESGDGGALGIGGAVMSKAKTAALKSQIAQERADENSNKTLFARMFDTESSDSFLSQLAIRVPASIGELATLPRVMASSISQTTNPALSAAAPTKNSFGFDFNYGFTDAELTADPDTYNPEVCQKLNDKREASYKKIDEFPIMVYTESDGCALEKVVVCSGMSWATDSAPEFCDIQNMNSPSDSGTGSRFRIATFNVLGASHTGGAFKDRMDLSMGIINDDAINIVGFQEFQGPQRKYFNQKMPGWELYPNTDDSSRGVNAIGWDTSKFTRVGQGMMPDLLYFGRSQLQAPWVILQDKVTGQKFHVLNTHDPAHPEWKELRYLNAKQHVKFIDTLRQTGLPVLFTGDFNSGYDLRDSGNITYENNPQNLTYCIMIAGKYMRDAYDVFEGRLSGKCPNQGNDNSVDHIFASSEVQVTKYFKRQGGKERNGSDVHDTHIADVTIPGSGTTETVGKIKAEKVLTFVVENKSFAVMKQKMNYTFNLAQKYAYATNYRGVARPSLPNYLAIASGSTQGVDNNDPPAKNPLNAQTVFGQALEKGKTAKTYAESMPTDCGQVNSGYYVPRHNPWTYFTNEKSDCKKFDVSMPSFASDVSSGNLPNAGFVIPNNCHNSHDDTDAGCKLSDADDWFKDKMQKIMDGPDWKSGKLMVVLTADEADKDDTTQRVLTVVMHKSLADKSLVVDCGIDHYSLSRLYSEIVGAEPLQKAAQAQDMAQCFEMREASGLTGGWSWPVDKKWWASNRSDFLNSHSANSGTFTSPAANSIASDISSPPSGSPVYSMLDGKIVRSGYGVIVIRSNLGADYLDIAYGHGNSYKFKEGDTVKSGDQIMNLASEGNSSGPHVHIDMSLNSEKHICPQDVFLAMGKGLNPDLKALTKKGIAPCGRS